MKSYYVLFTYKGKKVCSTYKRAESGADAELMAEFSLIAHYPNVSYDSVKATPAE